MQPEDKQLIDQYLRGNTAALEELVKRYQDKVVGFFFRLCWDRFTAEDLAQESFIKAIQSISGKTEGPPFSIMLFRIARLQWFNFLRKKYRSPRTQGMIEEYESFIRVDDEEFDPEERESKKEQIRRMLAAVEHLPEEQRIVVEMCYFLEVPYKEIAEILEIPVGTVKSRLNTAITRLRGHMQREDI
ncbi:MAG: RNA polymerase sigma factor RpoE [Planctomycetota bacterium]